MCPLETSPERGPKGQIQYRTTVGMANGQSRIIAANNMLHIPLYCFDGLKGISPVRAAMQNIGTSIAATKYSARFFGNGSRPGGVLTAPPEMDEEALAVSISSWEATQGGENSGRTALLPGEWKYTAIGLSPEESQFLETLKHHRTSIAGLFRVPPHKIGDTTTMGRGNHEQEELSFVTDTLKPYMKRLEQEIIRKLFPNVGRNSGRYFVEFDVRERLRGDFASQAQGFALGRQWGWYSVNDVRAELGENPVGAQGDVYLYPTNMGNAKQLLLPAPTGKQQNTEQQNTGQQDTENKPATPTAQERNIVHSLTASYMVLFQDAITRYSSRSKKDSAQLTTVFKPLLVTIADQVERQAASQFSLDHGWHGDLESVVRDHLKAMEKRSAAWTPEKAEETTATELTKAIRSLTINIFRAAGAAVALKGIN